MTRTELESNPILRGLAEQWLHVKAAFALHFSGQYSEAEAYNCALLALWYEAEFLRMEKRRLERLVGVEADPLVPPSLEDAVVTARAYHLLRGQVAPEFLEVVERLALPEADAVVRETAGQG